MKSKIWLCEQLLKDGLEKLNIPKFFTSEKFYLEVLELLQLYIEEIELFNEAYGLVKVNNRSELIIKHIFDSLSPIAIVTSVLESKASADVWQIADVGSGAGLPGIPLAVCLPGASFVLIERMGKRAGFLLDCIAILGISNVQAEEREAEKVLPGMFDLVVFRAFRPLAPSILKSLFRILKPGGFLAAWKGRYESCREEMIAAEKSLPGFEWEIYPLDVPFLNEERHLIIIFPGNSLL